MARLAFCGFTLADALLGIETALICLPLPSFNRFTLADALLGIETLFWTDLLDFYFGFTLADALLGIETECGLGSFIYWQ